MCEMISLKDMESQPVIIHTELVKGDQKTKQILSAIAIDQAHKQIMHLSKEMVVQ